MCFYLIAQYFPFNLQLYWCLLCVFFFNFSQWPATTCVVLIFSSCSSSFRSTLVHQAFNSLSATSLTEKVNRGDWWARVGPLCRPRVMRLLPPWHLRLFLVTFPERSPCGPDRRMVQRVGARTRDWGGIAGVTSGPCEVKPRAVMRCWEERLISNWY